MATDRISQEQDGRWGLFWAAVQRGIVVPPGQAPPSLPGLERLAAPIAADGLTLPLPGEKDTFCGRQRNLAGFAGVDGWISCRREPNHEGLCKGGAALNGEPIEVVWGGPQNVGPMRLPGAQEQTERRPAQLMCGAVYLHPLGADRTCTLPLNHENIYHLDQTRADAYSLGFKWPVATLDLHRCEAIYRSTEPVGESLVEVDARCRLASGHTENHHLVTTPHGLVEWWPAPDLHRCEAVYSGWNDPLMTGTRCELALGHTENHRGPNQYGSVQWPEPDLTEHPTAPVSVEEEIAALRRQLAQEHATKEQALGQLAALVGSVRSAEKRLNDLSLQVDEAHGFLKDHPE